MRTDRESGRSPRVSVLMPIHNQADLLPVSLESVQSQTLSDIEVLVVGDGCTDASEDVARSTGDSRVTWHGYAKAPGYGYANRQRALAAARGQLVAYLAPDDLWAPDHLATLVATLDAECLDMVFSRPMIVRANGALNVHYFPFDLWLPPHRAALRARLHFVSPTQVVHTRKVLDRAGGWDAGLTQFGDIDLWLRMSSSGAQIRFVDVVTAVRLPGPTFRHATVTRRELQARLARQLLHARRDDLVNAARQSRPRRVAGWLRDAATIGLARGPALFAARRSARSRHHT